MAGKTAKNKESVVIKNAEWERIKDKLLQEHSYIHSTWDDYKESSIYYKPSVVFKSSDLNINDIEKMNKTIEEIFKEMRNTSQYTKETGEKSKQEIIKDAIAAIQVLKNNMVPVSSKDWETKTSDEQKYYQSQLFYNLQEQANKVATFFKIFGYEIVDKNGKLDAKKEGKDLSHTITASMIKLLLRDYSNIRDYWSNLNGIPTWFWGSFRNFGGQIGEIAGQNVANAINGVTARLTGTEMRSKYHLTTTQKQILSKTSTSTFLTNFANKSGKPDIKMKVDRNSFKAEYDINFSVKNVIGSHITIDSGVSLNTMFTMMTINNKYQQYSFGSWPYYHILNIAAHKNKTNTEEIIRNINEIIGYNMTKVILNTLIGNEIHYMFFYNTDGVPIVVPVEKFIDTIVEQPTMLQKILKLKDKNSKINPKFQTGDTDNKSRAERVLKEVSNNIYFRLIVNKEILDNFKPKKGE